MKVLLLLFLITGQYLLINTNLNLPISHTDYHYFDHEQMNTNASLTPWGKTILLLLLVLYFSIDYWAANVLYQCSLWEHTTFLVCDQKFFSELTREASEIAGCFSSRVRRLLHLHVSSGGLQRYMWRLRHCFTDDQQILIQEGRMLLDYVTMNAIAIRKILKKYDKVSKSKFTMFQL